MSTTPGAKFKYIKLVLILLALVYFSMVFLVSMEFDIPFVQKYSYSTWDKIDLNQSVDFVSTRLGKPLKTSIIDRLFYNFYFSPKNVISDLSLIKKIGYWSPFVMDVELYSELASVPHIRTDGKLYMLSIHDIFQKHRLKKGEHICNAIAILGYPIAVQIELPIVKLTYYQFYLPLTLEHEVIYLNIKGKVYFKDILD